MSLLTSSKPLQAWSVGALLQAVAQRIGQGFNPVRVQGELIGITRAASGHVYFSLKDAGGQMRCAWFRRYAEGVKFTLREGQKVQATGKLDIYSARGELQMLVEHLQPMGQGDWYELFLERKERLNQEGLFHAERKRPIPRYVRRIGVVTSTQAAALQDVLTTLKRRVPHLPVVVFPSLVQGDAAPVALQAALKRAFDLYQTQDPHGACDVLLLVRGGGSIEDLWCFNDEALVRWIAQAPMPIIAGIGHETDVTLADFVADVRAATPTAAAELCALPLSYWLERWQQQRLRLVQVMEQRLMQHQQTIDRQQVRLGKPSMHLQRLQDTLMKHQQRLQWFGQQHQQQRQHRLNLMAQALEHGHPQTILNRGFVWLESQSLPITPIVSIQQLTPAMHVKVQMKDGKVAMKVESLHDE